MSLKQVGEEAAAVGVGVGVAAVPVHRVQARQHPHLYLGVWGPALMRTQGACLQTHCSSRLSSNMLGLSNPCPQN